MKRALILLVSLFGHFYTVQSSTQSNVPFQRLDDWKTRDVDTAINFTDVTTPTEASSVTLIDVTSTVSPPESNMSKAGDLKLFGVDFPDLPSLNSPVLGAMPCISTISARPGLCNADATCGGTSHPDGPCALSLGTCCTNFVTCGSFSLSNVSMIASPGYPAPFQQQGQLCEITINKYLFASQLRIDFHEFELAPIDPLTGLCSDDSLEILGLPGVKLPRICGSAAGQHLYIPLTLTVLQIKLKFVISSKPFARKFKLQVTQFEKNHWNSAPSGCLQYYAQSAGTLSSLVLEKTPLTKLSYAICFKYFNDVCTIKLTPRSPRLARSIDFPDSIKSSIPSYGYSLMKSADVYSHMSHISKPLLPEVKSHNHGPASYVPSKSYKSFPLVHESPESKSYVAPLPLPLPIPSIDKLKEVKVNLLEDLIEKKLLALQTILLDLHKLNAGELIAKSLHGINPLPLSAEKLPKGQLGKYYSHAHPIYGKSNLLDGLSKSHLQPQSSPYQQPQGYRLPYAKAYGKDIKNIAAAKDLLTAKQLLDYKMLLGKELLGKEFLHSYGTKSPPFYHYAPKVEVPLHKPLLPLKPVQLGMPMIPGFPMFKSPSLLTPVVPTLQLPEIKPLPDIKSLIQPLVPVPPVVASLKPLNMTQSLACAGKSSISHAPGKIHCSDKLEEIALTTAPFILFVDDSSDVKPFTFAFSYSRGACTPGLV